MRTKEAGGRRGGPSSWKMLLVSAGHFSYCKLRDAVSFRQRGAPALSARKLAGLSTHSREAMMSFVQLSTAPVMMLPIACGDG